MANFAKHQDTIFHVGDTVDVHYRLIEKEKVAGKTKREVKEEVKERTQVFEGVVISIRGERANKTFTVRRIGTAAIGIERIFPLDSPWIKAIKVKKAGKVRRAKLYYLREKTSREVEKLKEKSQNGKVKERVKEKKPTKKAAKPHEKKQ